LNPQTGIIIAAVMSIMEFILKPLIANYSWRESDWFKKQILPLIVLILSIGGAFFIAPVEISGIGAIILYGFGVGLFANFLYRSGLSYLSNKIGIETKINNSIFPPKE